MTALLPVGSKRLAKALCFVGALAMTGTASAQDDAALVELKQMTSATALRAAQAALAHCRNLGYQVAVAVSDRFGLEQVLLRDRFAGAHTPRVARGKAWTAASFKMPTTELAGVTAAGKSASGIRDVPGVMALGGGLPIQAAGSLVGAIGVSGAPGGSADDACAQAGIDAIQDDLDF